MINKIYIYTNNDPISLWDVLGEYIFQNQPLPQETYSQEDIVFINNPDTACSACNNKLQILVQTMGARYYAAQKEQFKKRIKCRLEATCGQTVTPSAKGQHQASPERNDGRFTIRGGRITMNCKCPQPMDVQFTHELTHAIDTCEMGMPKTCEDILLTEYNAYASAQCANAEDLRSCLRRYAFNSAMTSSTCNTYVGGPVTPLKGGGVSKDDQDKLNNFRKMFEHTLDNYMKKHRS